jgi:hypothetical protein
VPIALIYHDVVPAGQFEASGFPGTGAARYKFFEGEFHGHLEALQRLAQPGAPLACNLPLESAGCRKSSPLPCLLTFDDGGSSSILTIAGMLEERGWSGHFFIPTDLLDSPAFLSRRQVLQLRQRGHVVGSHSCSHPLRMSACTWEQLVDEWRRSCDILSDIIGSIHAAWPRPLLTPAFELCSHRNQRCEKDWSTDAPLWDDTPLIVAFQQSKWPPSPRGT